MIIVYVLSLALPNYHYCSCFEAFRLAPKPSIWALRDFCLGGDELKTAPQQGEALELSFHCFPWLIKKESTNYNWEEDLDVRA